MCPETSAADPGANDRSADRPADGAARRGSPAGLVPPDFLFGVATAGFQVEGGVNGPGEPANNWVAWERTGRVEPSGIALDFWNRYEEQLDRVAGLGCNSFRLSVEWARVEPAEGQVDEAALTRYRDILDACHGRGLIPLVTMHHFTHPAWLGEDFWLRPDAPSRFADWAARVLDALGDRCRHWVTLNEVNVLAAQSYLDGSMPPGRLGAWRAGTRALDHLLSAHVIAADRIATEQPGALVGTNTYAVWLYEFDRMFHDVIAWRARGVERRDLDAWLAERRADFERRAGAPRGGSARAWRALAHRLLPSSAALPRTVAAVEAARHDDLLGTTQVDFYDPVVSHRLRPPGHRSAGGRNWRPVRELWDDPPDPGGLTRYLNAVADGTGPLWVVENGLCNRVRHGRAMPRLDGWDRGRYLRAHVGAVLDARRAGAPVSGYWHWTLADNYEWGTYEPRFGLFGVDRARGSQWSELDAMGMDAAGAYRRVIAGLRSGDASVLDADAGDGADGDGEAGRDLRPGDS
jgi:beta-glucosidase/6-phospho-beta-glucosidase/beta-galactosidase